MCSDRGKKQEYPEGNMQTPHRRAQDLVVDPVLSNTKNLLISWRRKDPFWCCYFAPSSEYHTLVFEQLNINGPPVGNYELRSDFKQNCLYLWQQRTDVMSHSLSSLSSPPRWPSKWAAEQEFSWSLLNFLQTFISIMNELFFIIAHDKHFTCSFDAGHTGVDYQGGAASSTCWVYVLSPDGQTIWGD